MMNYDSEEIRREINRMSRVGIIGNVVLAALKMYAGIAGKSSAMISDAVHSVSDVLATFIAFAGTKIASKTADDGHNYGHEKFESLASLALGCILIATGIGIGYAGFKKIIGGNYSELEVPTALPLIAAAISILVKEGMYHYTKHYAKKVDSSAFMADAWHHRSDALSSIGSFIGIGAAIMGFPIMDSVASIVICLIIMKVAYDIIKSSVDNLTDASCDSEFEDKIADIILGDKDVIGIDSLQTRMFGNRIYIDIVIVLDRNISLVESHDIAERIHDNIEARFSNVKHVMVHVHPSEESKNG